MPECARCGAFTDNQTSGEHQYCDNCLDRFAEVENSGVVVEGGNGDYHIVVTDSAIQDEGGKETSQVEALARGKYIADEHGLDALFKYHPSGSTWILEDYLGQHPDIRQDIHERLRRVPEGTPSGIIERIRSFL